MRAWDENEIEYYAMCHKHTTAR